MKLEHLIDIAQKAVYTEHGDALPKYKMKTALSAIFNAISEISATEDVTIYGFGTFSRRTAKERTINTAFTKGDLKIEEHLTPRFKPSPVYKAKFRYGKIAETSDQ